MHKALMYKASNAHSATKDCPALLLSNGVSIDDKHLPTRAGAAARSSLTSSSSSERLSRGEGRRGAGVNGRSRWRMHPLCKYAMNVLYVSWNTDAASVL